MVAVEGAKDKAISEERKRMENTTRDGNLVRITNKISEVDEEAEAEAATGKKHHMKTKKDVEAVEIVVKEEQKQAQLAEITRKRHKQKTTSLNKWTDNR